MNRCKTCKYFTPNSSSHETPHAGRCSSEKFQYVFQGDTNTTPVDGLGYWDFEGFDAGFEVGWAFGCIHHEERPA